MIHKLVIDLATLAVNFGAVSVIKAEEESFSSEKRTLVTAKFKCGAKAKEFMQEVLAKNNVKILRFYERRRGAGGNAATLNWFE